MAHGVLPPLPSLAEPKLRQEALLARVTARSSALAGLDDLDRKKREAPSLVSFRLNQKSIWMLIICLNDVSKSKAALV